MVKRWEERRQLDPRKSTSSSGATFGHAKISSKPLILYYWGSGTVYHAAFCQAQQHPKNLSLAHAVLLQEGRSNPGKGWRHEHEEQPEVPWTSRENCWMFFPSPSRQTAEFWGPLIFPDALHRMHPLLPWWSYFFKKKKVSCLLNPPKIMFFLNTFRLYPNADLSQSELFFLLFWKLLENKMKHISRFMDICSIAAINKSTNFLVSPGLAYTEFCINK